MPPSSMLFNIPSNKIAREGNWSSDRHFQWRSVKRFLTIAGTMSAVVFNYDLFAKISTNVRILDFFLLQLTVGLPYLCMDSFIKQYTRKFDSNKHMNPLLRGISFGQFLQTGFISLIHGAFIVDTFRFLIEVIREVPSWAVCNNVNDTTCVPMRDVILHCNTNRTTAFVNTSAFVHYVNYFTLGGRKTMTSYLFVSAIVWISAFFLSSVTEETIIKIFRLTIVFRVISTIVTLLLLLIATNSDALAAFSEILNIKSESSWGLSMQKVTYTYGIGFLGIYDYGTISVYTMMDTASVLFMATTTILAFLRSWILKILYLGMIKCIVIDETYAINTHNLLYAVLPSTTEFLQCKKYLVLYLYGNLAITLMSFETFMISSMSKFLHYEFRIVKQIYIVGMVCAFGFLLTVILSYMSATTYEKRHMAAWEQRLGIDFLLLYLSGFRVIIIFWLYGVNKFASDIHFWLGFRPTKYWTISWSLMPVILIYFMVNKCYLLLQFSPQFSYVPILWVAFTILVVMGFQIRAIAKYLVTNNIIGLFVSDKLYGPPEPEDRKRRQFYNKITRERKCRHNCMVIDEWFDCDHDVTIKMRKIHLAPVLEERAVQIQKSEESQTVTKSETV